MKVPNMERNMRIYIGSTRGLGLTEIAKLEHITTSRVYQIIAATEYQLAKGNPDYWEAQKKYLGK